MAKFYDLKRELHFPRMAGVLKSRYDAPILYALLRHEREQSSLAHGMALAIAIERGEEWLAQRLVSDFTMLDECYRDDIKLLYTYITTEGLSFI